MPHRLCCAFLLLACFTTAAQHAPRASGGDGKPAKAAWLWTEDERIAARLDTAAAQVRVNEAMSREAVSRSASPGRLQPRADALPAPREYDVISGKDHPELFLPYEVFRNLMDTAFGVEDPLAVTTRQVYLPEIKALKLPDDFWDVLAAQSAEYIVALRTERSARETARGEADRARYDAALNASCRARAIALRNARQAFGREKFDRFLYEAYAPRMTSSWTAMPDAQRLKREEAGCP